jgi:hypothetical protein
MVSGQSRVLYWAETPGWPTRWLASGGDLSVRASCIFFDERMETSSRNSFYRQCSTFIPAASVRANHVPRGVSRAEAFLPLNVTLNMPSRARSAMVTPNIRLFSVDVGRAVQTPSVLCNVPSPHKKPRQLFSHGTTFRSALVVHKLLVESSAREHSPDSQNFLRPVVTL